ncbi:MAG TPA: clostripain-related cysteine peptidase [Candidatus Eremiobacteraeota bacterium]|nr:MAG: Clostripain precursor [bacterium ADurb.Bin363]HPZ06620.1 clostripain-related cysteine peptidase [Candidatus Eremiobacteraeota bacterium]
MKILRSSYKPHFPDRTVLPYNLYAEKQLEPYDRLDLTSGIKEKEWTLLFYNAGDGCEAKMGTASLLDLERIGSDENTNVVVMNYRSKFNLDRITGDYGKLQGAKTYYITRNENPPEKFPLISKILSEEAKHLKNFTFTSTKDIASSVIEEHAPDINMGDKETLKEFLLKNMKKFPARRYAVVMSGHGSAFSGSMIVHNPEGRIKNEELAGVFRDVEKETGHKIDLVNINTCFSANLESLYPLQNSVGTVVASEDVVWSATQPFGKILDDLQKGIKEGKEISARDLALLMIEEARRQPLGNLYIKTLSAIDMEKIGAVADDINNLQKTLMEEGVPPASIKKAMEESLRFEFSSVPKEVYVSDVGSFAKEIIKYSNSEKVRTASENLQKSLEECVFAEQHAAHAMQSVTSRVISKIFTSFACHERLEEASGLTVYYDTDALNPDSRLDQIEGWMSIPREALKKLPHSIDIVKLDKLAGKEFSKGRLTSELKDLKFNEEEIKTIMDRASLKKSKYSEDVDAVGFLSYVSKVAEEEKANMSSLRKGWNRVKETHKKVIRTISEKTHIPGFILSFAEKVAMAAGLFVGVHMLGTTGKAVYEAGLGGLFTLEGPLATLKSTKDTLKLISATDESAASFKDLKDSAELASGEKLTGREKEKIMDHIGNAVLGLTLGTFGLYLLGVAPRSVIWPAAIAALSIRSGKEVAKTLVSKKDHDDFIKESKEFSEMTVTEKLDYIQKNRN